METSLIDEVIQEAEIDEDAAAWAALQPKIARWQGLERAQFSQKAGGFLARRGFGHEVARRVIDRAWNGRNDDQTAADVDDFDDEIEDA
jgi:SOS response regulatory protein OraA/RecX